MTMRLDIVTNDAGEGVRREHARELGAGVVIAIYRLAKLAQLHDLSNQAFTRQLEQTHQIIGDYCLRSGSNVNVLFAHKAVFVAGQLLKGSRTTYEAASELGDLFERLGGSELHVQRDVTREELLAFAEQISNSYRGQTFRSPTPKIRLRPVSDSARLRGLELESLGEDQRIVRMYASAVVIMRRFFQDLHASRYILPRRIKRIAQSLVDLGSGSNPAFLGVTEVRNANFDEAGRAVNTAILAVAMAREVTHDRAVLSQIAMAAMMHDVGRPRALALSQGAGAAMPGMQGPTMLSEDQEDRLAAGAAAVLTALGRMNEPSITRTVLTFEALWIRRQTWLGPVYWGARPATLHAKLIAIARRYNDLLTPEPGVAPPTPDYAVATLSEELRDPQDRTVLRMLVSGLGLLPMGTVVQLSTGEIAEVVRGPTGLGEKPRVRFVMDARGQPVEAVEIELSQDRHRSVARVMSVDGWRKGLELAPQVGGEAYGDERESEPPKAASPAASASPAALPAISPLAMPPPGGTPHAQDTSRSISDQYVDSYASGSEDGNPGPGAPRGSSIQSAEQNSSASLPSIGSTPSAVAEAMGRMIHESVPPSTITDGDRTLFQASGDGVSAPAASRLGSVRPPREPTARGSLAATPLPHVLVYMLDHSLTGSVVFEGRQGDDAIHFVKGVPTKVRLQDAVALLGQILVHGGALETSVVEQAASGARRLGVLFGEYLVGHDLVSRDALTWALEAQLLNKVAHLANLSPDIAYGYYRDVDLLDAWGGGDVHVGCALSPILASVRNWKDRARVRATLNRIGKHPLALHEDSSLTNLALLPEEQATLDQIRAETMPLAQLFKRNVADDAVVSTLVYSLAVTRQFAFKGQKKGPMAAKLGSVWSSSIPADGRSIPAPLLTTSSIPSPRSPARPRSVEPAPSRLKSRPPPRPMPPAARPSPQGMPRTNPPQIRPMTARRPTFVGIQPAHTAGARTPSLRPPSVPAGAELAPAATFQPALTVPQTPPDGMKTIARPAPRPQSAKARASATAVERLPARPSSAHTNRGPESTGEIDIDFDEGVGRMVAGLVERADEGSAEAAAALDAMQSFRLAEAALQRNDVSSAQKFAQMAVHCDASQSDYVTLLAWIRSLSGSAQALTEAINTMSNVLNDDPSNERALLYRGKLFVRAERLAEAAVDLRALLAQNPQHRDAAAELRQLTSKIG